MRSSSALQSRAFGITCVHSENGRFVVRTTAAFSARSATTWNRNSAPTPASGTSPRAYRPNCRYQQTIGFLVISAHWGGNWGYRPPEEHVVFGRALIDAGADVV